MRHHVLRLFPLLATACVAPLADEPAEPTQSGSSTSTPTDDATTVPLPPPPQTTTEPEPGTTISGLDTDASATAGSSTGGGLGEGEECELTAQDCASGLKCMPYSNDGSGAVWNATACFPIVPDPADVGEPCQWIGGVWSGYDDCGWSQICWSFDQDQPAVCKELCLAGHPEDFDTYTCEDPLAVPFIGCQTCFCVCELPCDPLAQDCGEDQECIPALELFECAPDASGDAGAYGEPCEYSNVCDPGLACLPPETVPGCAGEIGCCTPYCDTTQPNTCPGAAEGQTCQPWYEPGAAPPGLEHVGACALP